MLLDCGENPPYEKREPGRADGKLIYQTVTFDNFLPSTLFKITKGDILNHLHRQEMKTL